MTSEIEKVAREAPVTNQCETCRFWLRRTDGAGSLGGGYCRRFPPLTPATVTFWKVSPYEELVLASATPCADLCDSWPNVTAQSWCGEFQKAETPE